MTPLLFFFFFLRSLHLGEIPERDMCHPSSCPLLQAGKRMNENKKSKEDGSFAAQEFSAWDGPFFGKEDVKDKTEP